MTPRAYLSDYQIVSEKEVENAELDTLTREEENSNFSENEDLFEYARKRGGKETFTPFFIIGSFCLLFLFLNICNSTSRVEFLSPYHS